MIPKIVPPLTGLTVLVTRPAPQCGALCEQIDKLGGVAHAFPALDIEPLAAAPASEFDLAIFLSVNAVAHGASLVQGTTARIAAIGKATAAALAQSRLPADLIPGAEFNSEALLDHPDLNLTAGARVLIVHGEGGRQLLQDTLVARGMVVETREVYRRARPALDESRRAQIEALWQSEGIDVVTLTSIETLRNLQALLTERGRDCLRTTAVLVASRRIAAAACADGLQGPMLCANGADDTSMIGALSTWNIRARHD